MKFFLLFLFAMTMGFGQLSWGWSVVVKGEQLNYSINSDTKNFSYKDAYISKSWAIKPCNKKIFEKVEADFHTAFKKRVEVKGKFPQQLTYTENKKPLQVAQISPFGIFLTQFPNRVISLASEEEQACKTSGKPAVKHRK
jgi:hypothetical protein